MGRYRDKGLACVSSCSAEHFQGCLGGCAHHTQAPTCLSLQQLDLAQGPAAPWQLLLGWAGPSSS